MGPAALAPRASGDARVLFSFGLSRAQAYSTGTGARLARRGGDATVQPQPDREHPAERTICCGRRQVRTTTVSVASRERLVNLGGVRLLCSSCRCRGPADDAWWMDQIEADTGVSLWLLGTAWCSGDSEEVPNPAPKPRVSDWFSPVFLHQNSCFLFSATDLLVCLPDLIFWIGWNANGEVSWRR